MRSFDQFCHICRACAFVLQTDKIGGGGQLPDIQVIAVDAGLNLHLDGLQQRAAQAVQGEPGFKS